MQGLEELCTSEKGGTSVISNSYFDAQVRKTDNSIFTAGQEFLDAVKQRTFLVFTGITTTSCILKSIQEVREKFADRVVIVPRNAVASRVSQKKKEDELFEEWRDSNDERVIVVPTLRSIYFSN